MFLAWSPDPTQSFKTALLLTPIISANVNYGGYTFVVKIPGNVLGASGSSVKLTLLINSGATDINGVYISQCAAAGGYNSLTTPTPVTFNKGSATVSLQSTTPVISDVIPFNLDASKANLVSFNMGTTNATSVTSAPSGVIVYRKAASAEAGTASRSTSGYLNQSGLSYLINKIEAA